MRLAAVLACLTVAATQPGLAADNLPTPAAPSPSAPASPQAAPAERTTDSIPVSSTSADASNANANAAATAPTAGHADSDSDELRLEKRMHGKGYVTRIQSGEKFFCRREQVLGTRLGGSLRCMTAAEARVNEQRQQQDEELLRQRVMQSCLRSGSQGGKVVVTCGN